MEREGRQLSAACLICGFADTANSHMNNAYCLPNCLGFSLPVAHPMGPLSTYLARVTTLEPLLEVQGRLRGPRESSERVSGKRMTRMSETMKSFWLCDGVPTALASHSRPFNFFNFFQLVHRDHALRLGLGTARFLNINSPLPLSLHTPHVWLGVRRFTQNRTRRSLVWFPLRFGSRESATWRPSRSLARFSPLLPAGSVYYLPGPCAR